MRLRCLQCGAENVPEAPIVITVDPQGVAHCHACGYSWTDLSRSDPCRS